MFELTEEEKLIRDTAREFAQTKLAQRAVEYDKNEEFPLENYSELGELGFMGILVPEEYGGSNLGDFVLAMVVEEVSRICASTAVALSVHSSLICRLIGIFATADQKEVTSLLVSQFRSDVAFAFVQQALHLPMVCYKLM